MIASTTLLNKVGTTLAADIDVHAITDVTGFGILGHGLEMARASGLTLRLNLADIPFLAKAEELAQQGFITGASVRNWASYGDAITLPENMAEWQRMLLADPQTSGGLLVAVAADKADAMVKQARDAGYPLATIVGTVEDGAAGIVVNG
ncbi:Selenide, water dikinase [compost metagenome]